MVFYSAEVLGSLLPGGSSRKQVQQTLSLSLNSEFTYSEMGNSEYPVPEQRIWVSSINSEYVNIELRACTTTIKSHHQWNPDTTSHHDNLEKKDFQCDGVGGPYVGLRRVGPHISPQIQHSFSSEGERDGMGEHCCPSQRVSLNVLFHWRNI